MYTCAHEEVGHERMYIDVRIHMCVYVYARIHTCQLIDKRRTHSHSHKSVGIPRVDAINPCAMTQLLLESLLQDYDCLLPAQNEGSTAELRRAAAGL
jgi:hypothetical protein